MKTTKRNYKELEKAVKSIKIKGFKSLKNGYVSFKGKRIDLTATSPNYLAIAYSTLKQINI